MIDLMPPGLYEAVIEDVGEDTANRDLIEGELSVPARAADARRHPHARRQQRRGRSEVRGRRPRVEHQPAALRNLCSAVRTTSLTPPAFGEWARKMHPNRVRFAIFSDENPAMRLVAEGAEAGPQEATGPVAEDNIFSLPKRPVANAISGSLSAFGAARDAMTEQLFHLTYGSPLPAGAGRARSDKATPRPRARARCCFANRRRRRKRAELEDQVRQGRRSRGGASLDRLCPIAAKAAPTSAASPSLKQLHDAQPPGRPRTMAELKEVLRDQSLLLRLDEKRAVAAIPKLLPRDAEDRVADAAGHPARRDRPGRAVRRRPSSGSRESRSCSATKRSEPSKEDEADVRA